MTVGIGGYAIKYKFDIGPKNYLLWLFNRTPCVKCFGKLTKKRWVKITEPKVESNGIKKVFYHMRTPHEVRDITHGFVCEICKSEFTFKEIRGR